ncbi:AAA family ATPase [Myxococcus sp. K15C18031901]|uniref:AAA family ATPase n=1 Tax=Myxococcus dinghuensis TaxID=2906761 RepID=UPI0020A78E7A|nr:AAA family ATPase [Myxococcus dinghuensis]MCP3102352.1 AAA family ATPase [Myxococcus dinghuensis]
MTPSSGVCLACGTRLPPGSSTCPRAALAARSGTHARRWGGPACQPPLAGRVAPLERLKWCADEARRGLGRAVWLTGVEGMGKSRLKDALVEACGEGRFELWEGSALAFPGTPAGPFLDLLEATRALRPVDGVSRMSSAEVERVAAFVEGREWPGIPASVSAESTALMDALCHALLPRNLPRLLVLEDWQHADSLSRAIVEVLVTRLAHASMLVLVLERSTGAAPVPAPAEVLELAPLTLDESLALVGTRLHVGAARDALLQVGAGHPLWLLQALAFLEEHPSVPLPASPAAVAAARLAALPATRREVLQRASVLGPCFPRAVLGALAGGFAPVASLEVGGWLRPVTGGRYVWGARGPGLDEVWGEEARLALHRQAAEAYEALPEPARRRACAVVVSHWLDAKTPERALPHLAEVARWYLAALESTAAIGVYRFALEVAATLEPEPSGRWCRALWESLGDAHRLAGARVEAEAAWRQALLLGDVSDDAAALAERLRRLQKLASVVLSLGRPEEVVALVASVPVEVAVEARLPAAALHALGALSLCMLGRYDEAESRLTAASAGLTAVPLQEGPARASVEAAIHRARGTALMGQGRPEQATTEYAAMLRWTERAGDTWEHSAALFNLGDAYARAGDRERAVHFFQLALDLKARTGDRGGMAYTHHGLALLHSQADAPELAKEDAVRGLQLASMLGDRKLKSLLRCALGRAHLRLGEREEAARQLQLAAQDAAAAGARPELLQAQAALRALDARR